MKKISSGLAFTSNQTIAIRAALLDWFSINGRHWIPWKLKADGSQPEVGESLNPYEIWVAEVMLQQTQLKIVLPYWQKWMQVFPTPFDLAKADEEEVLLCWQGLGYYSRARRLQQSAQMLLNGVATTSYIESKFWPKDLESWMALPGIGRTTAGSILSSAFNYPSAILDGNVKRVFSRLIASSVPSNKNISLLWKISDQLLDKENPRNFNQSLMDLGSTVCTPRNPNCLCCPIKKHCIAYSSNSDPSRIPVKTNSKPLPKEVIGIGIVCDSSGKILIDKRLNNGVLGGLWEFPGGKQENGESIVQTISRELQEELSIKVDVLDELISFEHSYSHKKLLFIVHRCYLLEGIPKPLASKEVRWVKLEDLHRYPFPAANGKMIEALFKVLEADNLPNLS